jgi:hypothetical protein
MSMRTRARGGSITARPHFLIRSMIEDDEP